ncbi:MAG: UBP-type zinc finger domain-containing protein [Pseudonocardiaceae bacterium]
MRRCATWGHVGCCDSPPHRHATGHFRGTAHPLIQSFEPGEDWYWCYTGSRSRSSAMRGSCPSPWPMTPGWRARSCSTIFEYVDRKKACHVSRWGS